MVYSLNKNHKKLFVSYYQNQLIHNPHVVFLDIKMPDGTGFNLLDRFQQIDFEVVFISGFDSYALKAFEFNAVDYVLKPIDSEKGPIFPNWPIDHFPDFHHRICIEFGKKNHSKFQNRY